MIKIEKESDVKIIYHFGHFSYSIYCPVCNEYFESHSEMCLEHLYCPYCKEDLVIKRIFSEHQVSA
jgi:transposase-like protein